MEPSQGWISCVLCHLLAEGPSSLTAIKASCPHRPFPVAGPFSVVVMGGTDKGPASHCTDTFEPLPCARPVSGVRWQRREQGPGPSCWRLLEFSRLNK